MTDSREQVTRLQLVWTTYQRSTPGQFFSILNRKWCKQYRDWSGYDLEFGIFRIDRVRADATRPGRIDNSELQDPHFPDYVAVLRHDLDFKLECVVVNRQVARILYAEFNKDSTRQYDRQISRDGKLNLYPTVLHCYEVDLETGDPNPTSWIYVLADTQWTCFNDIVSEILKTEHVQDEQKQGGETIRFWIEDPDDVRKRETGHQYSHVSISNFILIPFEDMHRPLESLEQFDGMEPGHLLIDRRKAHDGEFARSESRVREHQPFTSSEQSWTTSADEEDTASEDGHAAPHLIEGNLVDVQDQFGKWYSARIRRIAEDTVKVHYEGMCGVFDEYLPIDSDRIQPFQSRTVAHHQDEFVHVPIPTWSNSCVLPARKVKGGGIDEALTSLSPIEEFRKKWQNFGSMNQVTTRTTTTPTTCPPTNPGVVGLANLGNTCYMNCILQCLFHCTPLMQYLLAKRHQADLNETNAMGSGGKVLLAFVQLVEDYWSNTKSLLFPVDFRMAFHNRHDQFQYNVQQDASDFLINLLDDIHEDLNLIKVKPVTPYVECTGPLHELKAEEQVANDTWVNHLLRNKSIVVDRFQGMLKSCVTCPHCSYSSMHFEPYSILSLPVPNVVENNRVMSIILVRLGKNSESNKLESFEFHLSKDGIPSEIVIAKLATESDIPSDRLLLAEVNGFRITRVFDTHDSIDLKKYCQTENQSSLPVHWLYAFEQEKAATASQPETVPIRIVHFMLEGTRWKLFGEPSICMVPVMANGQKARIPDLRTAMNALALQSTSVDPTELRVSLVGLDTLDPYRCYTCPLDSKCTGCTLPQNLSNMEEPTLDLNYSPKSKQCAVVCAINWRDSNQYFVPKCKQRDTIYIQVENNALQNVSSTSGLSPSTTFTLQECIAHFEKPEILGGSDLWMCGGCKLKQPASKTMTIWNTPDVLLIHLKRFLYNHTQRRKISTFVDFPLEGLVIKGAKYDCFAVAEHAGSLTGGHYTNYSRNKDSGLWYLFNDRFACQVKKAEEIVGKTAYILMYLRQGISSLN